MVKRYEYDLCGKKLEVTIGKVAEQANGACLIQSGETVILVTAVSSKNPRDGVDFFPLTCDFEEKLYAVGKFPGGYIKREGKPSDRAILISRLIDRPLRPLFPDGYRNDVQIIATALSLDKDSHPDILAMIGSSIALSISDIPFLGPTGAVSIGLVDGEFVINPDSEAGEKSDLNLTVSGTKDAIMMVEAGCNNVSEETVLNAILRAHEEIKGICDFILEIQKDCGKEKKEFVKEVRDQELEEKVKAFVGSDMKDAIITDDKKERGRDKDQIVEDTLENFKEEYPEAESEIKAIIEDIEKDEFRNLITKEKKRPDGRALDEIRPLSCDHGLLPRAHGSGLFKRGQTQVLSVTTLGTPSDVQVMDGMIEEEDKVYMHQYNFPPYSVGDVRPLRGPGRRELGHGALAERALLPVIPSEEEFPYTIRVVSEVLSSNGSSSQASICGSTLSLLDAGVPIKAPVAGIAMGLIKEDDDVIILTDIQGLEDHLGDMDFKVAGTKDGITALQMDIKIDGISEDILKEALERAKKARLEILSVINEEISQPNQISKYAPRLKTIQVKPEKVREIIGPGGKLINKIITESKVNKIDTEDDGKITISGDNFESVEKALEMINEIIREPEVGEKYLGKVTKITNFGAFIEILPDKEGLLHISNISHERVNKVEDVLKVGDEIMVKLTDIDDQGRLNLSRKALLPKENRKEENKKND
ncbi:MAG: polyribonucleotide nucleotidyltransferase [Finegoldia sp.]|nr:polyribonucleotide nucleotidyltransferase [Finegoldia sp.]